MNEATKLSKKLAELNVREVTITWYAGGDDGSVESITTEPHVTLPDEVENLLEDFGWQIYSDAYDGGTAGEFYFNGTVTIIIDPETADYKVNIDGRYEEMEYIADELEVTTIEEHTTYEDWETVLE